MSLVVAEIADGKVHMVADTKITLTNGDEQWMRHVFKNAMPKIVPVRGDLAVGVAGWGPDRALEKILDKRTRQVGFLLDYMRGLSGTSFVVASIAETPRLWEVADGAIAELTEKKHAWRGDSAAYAKFRYFYDGWPVDNAEMRSMRLMTSIQPLLGPSPLSAAESVGGYLTRIASSDQGFVYMTDPSAFHIDPPMEIIPAAGRPPTRSALAYCIPQTNRAWLFTHDKPWESIEIHNVASLEALIEAGARHGQALAGAEHPASRR
jgi:hypothetical protein